MNDYPWIIPVGGLGDMLMLSTVLKQVNDLYPDRFFNLLRRHPYISFFRSHPAVREVGFPSEGADCLQTTYWNHGPLGPGRQRAIQVMGRMFGLESVNEDEFYMSSLVENDDLISYIPWKKSNIVMAPGSVSPRKEWKKELWDELAGMLNDNGYLVVQIGLKKDAYIKGAYSLLGLTDPRQILAVIKRADGVIAVDSYAMHAAHYYHKPSVVLWGPTDPLVYGYSEQTHLSGVKQCEYADSTCLDTGEKYINYRKKCHRDEIHCVSSISPLMVFSLINDMMNR